MSETAFTPQDHYNIGVKAYGLAVQFKQRKNTNAAISASACLLFGVGISTLGKSANYVARFFPDTPNQERQASLAVAEDNLATLNASSCDSVLLKNVDGRFSYVSIEQKKSDVKQMIATAEAQPASGPNTGGALLGAGLALVPALVMAVIGVRYRCGARGYVIQAQREKLLENEACCPLQIKYFDNAKTVAEKINTFAAANDLPEFIPPKRKKILGLF